MKVLCIGAAVLDITAYPIGQRKEWKEKQRIERIAVQIGGDAANQSVHLAALGWEPALVACVGDDANGRVLRALLESRGVNTDWVTAKAEHSTGTAIVLVDEAGERRTFSVAGAHSTLCRSDLPANLPEECQAISLASLFSMPELERDGLEEYLREAKNKGILITADLSADKKKQGFAGVERFLPLIDYFVPSLYDVLAMTGKATAEEAAEVFLQRGVGHVIIKCGARGAYLAQPGEGTWIPACPVRPVDTTGAGDCMSAVFLARILAGDTPEQACRYACGAASWSTLFLGASQAELSDRKIREFLSEWDRTQSACTVEASEDAPNHP